jgi:hypothetical protein
VKLHRGGQFFLAEKGNTYIRLHILVGYNIKDWFYFKDRRENWLSFCNWCLIVFFKKINFFNFKLIIFMILDRFNIILLKINFKK